VSKMVIAFSACSNPVGLVRPIPLIWPKHAFAELISLSPQFRYADTTKMSYKSNLGYCGRCTEKA
jgi:hypothetical protein